MTSNAYGISGMDTLKLTQWLQLSGGVRFDYFYTFVDATATTPEVSQLIQQPTYRGAIVGQAASQRQHLLRLWRLRSIPRQSLCR